MTFLNSKLKDHVMDTHVLDIGTLYFLEHIAIVEFNDGVHLTIENSKPVFSAIEDYFNHNEFGLIANRVNSYSIHPLEMQQIKDVYPNLGAYAVVATDKASKMSAEIENSFCQTHDINFDNLYEAVEMVSQRLLETIKASIS
jgi:hypothetical protein